MIIEEHHVSVKVKRHIPLLCGGFVISSLCDGVCQITGVKTVSLTTSDQRAVTYLFKHFQEEFDDV